MAKTSNSLTGNPNIKGAPSGFTLDIHDITVSVGAGFIIPISGEVNVHKDFIHFFIHFFVISRFPPCLDCQQDLLFMILI